MADYKLPRLGDIGEIVVELYEPESERARGVIGLGEPPVISPGGGHQQRRRQRPRRPRPRPAADAPARAGGIGQEQESW